MLIGGLTDCGANLLAAAAATRMRSKLGRYRPFLIYGAAPLGVTFGLLFIKPDLAPATVFAIAMIVHVCYRIAYAFIAVPHAGLITRSEVHTSALQSLMLSLYAVHCLQK